MKVDHFQHDISLNLTSNLLLDSKRIIAIDTETTGLDYRKHRLQLIQLYDKKRMILVHSPNWESKNLIRVLSGNNPKLFHFAQFDLGFLKTGLGVDVAGRIDCTKILMKILHPEWSSGLAASLREVCQIHIHKDENIQKSGWNSGQLSREQIEYACDDVIYLHQLFHRLMSQLLASQRDIYRRAIRAMKDKVFIETKGYTDLLQYEKESLENTLLNRNWWLRTLMKNAVA